MHWLSALQQARPLDQTSGRWALWCLVGMFLAWPVRSQEINFGRDCMRVAAEGLIMDTSAFCVGAFRTDPAARAQFIQLVQVTLAQTEAARIDTPDGPTPADALRRLFDKASLEPGRVVGVGGAYYGAQ